MNRFLLWGVFGFTSFGGLRSVLCDSNTVKKPVRSAGLVVTTWPAPCFQSATAAAYQHLSLTNDRVGAVVAGCSRAESLQCDSTVGYGNHPDERGETTLDAMIMDGPTHNMGAVGGMMRIRNAIAVARDVMDRTQHSMLVGESATRFAVEMGHREEATNTSHSYSVFEQWLTNKCQPNYWSNVTPDPRTNCDLTDTPAGEHHDGSHDTIGQIVIDAQGDICAGTSTNGMNHKVPGRIGDSPIVGAGAYVDNDVGAAAGTGDGDILMRLLPAYQAVESMRRGMSPKSATRDAMKRIVDKFPTFSGAVIAANKEGDHGASCHGMTHFTYSYADGTGDGVRLRTVQCV